MDEPKPQDERPPAPDAAPPEQPQTSLHAQTIGPKTATSDASPKPADRTLEEETLRQEHNYEEGRATEKRRDEG